jgi:hypothetical protein
MSTRHRRLMRLILITLLALTVLAILPVSVYACSGFMDCLFGFSERVEIRQTEMTERERISAQSAEEIARIAADQAEKERLADAEIERIKQQQFSSQHDRDLAIARERARVAEYKASLQALVDEKVENIRAGADTQIAALQEAAKIHIAGIKETGETQRSVWVGYYALRVVGLLILGAGLIIVLTRRPQPAPYVLPAQPHQVAGPAYTQRQIDGQAYTLPVRQRNEVQRHEQHWQ